MRVFTAIFHDDENEVQTDYKADTFVQAVQHAETYLDELGDGWGLVSVALEAFEYESLRRTGHVVPDIHSPEFGE